MNFYEALRSLKSGQKIRRYGWGSDNYLQMDEKGDILNYTMRLLPYIYDQNILLSDNWFSVTNENISLSWPEAIEALKAGSFLKRADWKNQYISLDKSTQCLNVHLYEKDDFMPTFTCFVSNDWCVHI